MNETEPNQKDPKAESPLFTFRSGGWVIMVSGILTLAVLTWAIAPAVLRTFSRPPGDGATIESYRFDLSSCLVDRELIFPIMLHRDMVPEMNTPRTMPGREVVRLNTEERGKFLVSEDRVIGIVLNGEARAYPIKLLNVHEIINDSLGGEAIAITYHWPCDSVRVFRRVIEGETVEFAVSGLLYNSNQLMYVRGDIDPSDEAHVPESLFNQLQARAITGPHAAKGLTLDVIPAVLISWEFWLIRHPDTTVVLEDPHYHKRYQGAVPNEYFITDKLIAPVDPKPDPGTLDMKTRVIVILTENDRRAYPLPLIASNLAEHDAWTVAQGEYSIRFEAYRDFNQTAIVSVEPSDARVEVIYGFWFAIHAMDPEIPLFSSPRVDSTP